MDSINYYGVVYKITCLVNNKIYIGKTTKTIEIRWKYHCYNKKKNYYLYNAIRKYGKENFKIEILCYCYNEIELNFKEVELIAKYDCRNREVGYNILPGGEGFGGGANHPWFGKTHSDETKQKLSELNKGEKNPKFGKIVSPETRKKMSESHRGKPKSEEIRRKFSIAKSGKNHPMYGKHHTEESKKKNSESNKGRIVSPETRKKMSEANSGEKSYMFGKHISEDVKRKLSKANSGENSATAVLNWQKVKEIRENIDNLTQKQLVDKYNVSLSSIRRVVQYKTWKIEHHI